MQHLLAAWPDIRSRLRPAKQVILLTDFDGTLTPIVEKPEMAFIPESTRYLLQSLANQRRIKLGVISGRALTDLKKRVNVAGIIYAGNHGFEIEGPGLSFVNPLADEIRPFFRFLSQLLIRTLAPIKGVLVENKGITLSVHYRQIEHARKRDMQRAFNQVVNDVRNEGKFKVTPGKKVFELRPDIDWDKGKAISLLLQKFADGRRNGDLVPIYFGDDLTDEDGFEAIGQQGNGVTVHIGNNLRRTNASYYLKSPDEVIEFLKLFLNSLKRGFE